MIIGDFNSHSLSWGYPTIDEKGEDLEAWMVDKGLILINRPDGPTTYTSIPWRTTSTPNLAIATLIYTSSVPGQFALNLAGVITNPLSWI